MKRQLQVSVGQHSDAGRKEVNQDFHGVYIPHEPLLSSKGIALAIADGISSSKVSQVASETAIKSFFQDYYSTSEAWSVKTSAQRVLKATNSWLYAQTRNSPYRYNKDKGYICTFSALILKSNTAYLFHTGDSRIYRLSGQSLEQLTTDHIHLVSEHTSYLTRALGVHDTLEMDHLTIPINANDVFILATDGVYEFLSAGFIANEVQQSTNLENTAKKLVNEAILNGSNDNLSIQIVRIETLPDQHLGEVQDLINLLPIAPPLSARMHFDGYNIIRDVYISSRSHVFLAEDMDTKQQVIIKTPSSEMCTNAGYLESFLMEDWIAQRISNPYVLKAISPGRKRHYLYSVSEYIEGQTLSQWMVDNPKPDIATVRNIVRQIAKGLQAFHRQEMVHQDLRPNNIMIDTSGTVKIIDFGSTKVAGISEVALKNEGLVGTAQFTAPEYYLGELGTPRSDLFSLGVMTYKMLSGKLPYGNAISKTHDRRSQGKLNYQPISNKDNNIPQWLDYTLSKAVHVEPLKRYEEVSEFIYDLNNPSQVYLNKTKPPLIDRNPVLFWQCVSFVLFIFVLYQQIK
jgi:serine/threonine protein phosphatase PrpC